MPAFRLQNVALAGALGAGAVLLCYANVFLGPYFFENYRPNPAPGLLLAMAGMAAILAAVVAVAWPQRQASLLRVLAVTAFIYLTLRPIGLPWGVWLSGLPLTPTQQYWVVRGPGGGVLGNLPATVIVLLGGRFLFGLSVREQWNGRLRIAVRDLLYGGGAAVLVSGLALVGAAATGNGRVFWEPSWDQNGVNLVSNLYEEVLARGLLLQIARREGGKWFAILWTGLVFGTMHAFGLATLAMAIGGWILAWVVLRAGSLWAGWVMHQGVDVIVDSCLH
jgi:membrane protease YdiL (CAAX protease family)